MQAILKAGTRLVLRTLFKPVIGSRLPLALQRRWMVWLTGALGRPRGTVVQGLEAGPVRLWLVRAGGPAGGRPADGEHARRAILFAHGGGFIVGRDAYVGLAAHLAAATGADVYLPEYRLAPEHPHPAPTDDLFAAYRAVLERGHEAGRVAIVGDSAGGALAVSTALALAEMDVPSPAALVLLSPWLDLSLSGASVAALARRDPVISRAFLERGGRSHAGGLELSDPRVSPLFADPRGLPPTLIQVGSDEMLLDDSTRFADRAWAAGVEVELQRFEGWWHVFQAQATVLRAARAALADVAAFLDRRLDGSAGIPGEASSSPGRLRDG